MKLFRDLIIQVEEQFSKPWEQWASLFVLFFQLGKDGCLSTVISTKTFQLYRSYARMYARLNVETIVTENGTGNTKWRLRSSWVSLKGNTSWEESPGSQSVHQMVRNHHFMCSSSSRTPLLHITFKRNCFLPISVFSPLYWVCLTGIQIKDYDYVAVNQENDRVMFRNMDLYYKRGIPYFGEVSSWEDTFRKNSLRSSMISMLPCLCLPF